MLLSPPPLVLAHPLYHHEKFDPCHASMVLLGDNPMPLTNLHTDIRHLHPFFPLQSDLHSDENHAPEDRNNGKTWAISRI